MKPVTYMNNTNDECFDVKQNELSAMVEREKRRYAEEIWREVSERIGSPCPIPINEMNGLTVRTAMERIQLMALEPLNHPGTPEYEECLSNVREMVKWDKTPRFPQILAQQERKEPNGKQ
jgi:hypothetical protein